MTTRHHARPAGSEPERPPAEDWHPRPSADPLGERLVAAREAKGIDLLRAERETKIGRGYLAALERGDYASLPGSVYVRGFLRNYAQYLGLDPDEAVAQWHREVPEDAPEPVIVMRRPLVAPRKGLVLSSGVAVAAGLAPWAVGTDTGGSVRLPSSWCGITGLKTTIGRVSAYGVLPLSPTLDTPGPMTRSVEDAALLYMAMQGPDQRRPPPTPTLPHEGGGGRARLPAVSPAPSWRSVRERGDRPTPSFMLDGTLAP